MKMKSKTKSCCQYTQWVVLALLLHLSLQVAKIMMTQQEILIRISLLSFLNSVQKKGGLGTRMLLYGENFGSDISK